MNKNQLWMVRAGEGAFLLDDFINKSIIAIGWNATGDLSAIEKIDKIKGLVAANYQEYKSGTVNISAGQIYRFIHEFKIGDAVMTYNPTERVYWIGEIDSDYKFDKEICEYNHIHKVKWIDKIPRDELSTSTKNTLGATLTIFDIPKAARDEIFNLLSGSKKPIVEIENEKESLEIIKEDFIAKSHEFIKDKVLSLDWEDMQELIAGILRAMGYKTRISPKGADRGKDIIASPDGLGLEEPKILVEVKHRQGQMGSQEVRSFLGGLRARDKGLYVSTGGFSKDSRYEAERSNIPITLIDSDMIVELISQNYDSFDSETKSLVPLKKIYWPI
ncbi:MAG: restriction endonuclease [Bacteroidetes bacterium GWC2_33_15]|nr:MAG: restriction endonuclease [Bacteroidetes bacterium GWA2_33_15]OFX49621.1 MAG: restriction endonuclease [Bacteroidetes bacterium GWC2_33_15]OFX66319.1 MAG: restriction endonuclease [Bacteroidetes bacterium GWB2_32_14]OFX70108.1 MAG: restriction endonuclease [Bacteroidetes bacterium GWD2_33_33]HAN17034.1 restriction endonuclease [Bacteroidales bacterium]